MKRKISILIVFALLAAILGGCQLFCKHEWADATCEAPQTCVKCEKTEGEALGHSWAEATCEAPETCGTCGMMRGEPKGHAWADATCDVPKTCTVCSLTEGEALGHTWEEATTEVPQTCTVCQVTEGEPLDTDDRFTTAATKELQGKWVTTVEMTGEDMGVSDFAGTLPVSLYMEFGNVGDMTMYMEIADEESFNGELKDYMKTSLYAELAAMGLDEAAADQAMQDTYGMSVDEYAQTMVESINFNEMIAAYNMSMVYYVEGDQMYSSLSWNGTFEGESFQIEDGVLTLETAVWGETGEPLEWTRVEE